LSDHPVLYFFLSLRQSAWSCLSLSLLDGSACVSAHSALGNEAGRIHERDKLKDTEPLATLRPNNRNNPSESWIERSDICLKSQNSPSATSSKSSFDDALSKNCQY